MKVKTRKKAVKSEVLVKEAEPFHLPLTTRQDAENHWAKDEKKAQEDNGAGGSEDAKLKAFLFSMRAMADNLATFTIHDARFYCKFHACLADTTEVDRLFDAYVTRLIGWGKVEIVQNSCNDLTTYLFK